MVKKINLLNVTNIINSELAHNDSRVNEYIGIKTTKDNEKQDICLLCEEMLSLEKDYHCVENFYLNYKIPQIDKEFDLLRIGMESVVNIELKSQSIDERDILKQLQRNYYYLSFLKRKIHCFVFIAKDKDFYQYDNSNNELIKVNIQTIVQVLKDIRDDSKCPNDLFVPSNYLISPFNNTEAFLESKYFLTSHQEEIQNEILKRLEANPYIVCSIAGIAGTGKTLLIYHIAKVLKEKGHNVMTVHCASSNSGIEKLKGNGWRISIIKDFNYVVDSKVNIVIFDEAHRIELNKLKQFMEKVKNQKCIIFAHDVNQKLNRHNKAEEVVGYIEENAGYKVKLSEKIRHNKQIASFIKKLFNLQKIKQDDFSQEDYRDISLYYAVDIEEAEGYIRYLVEKEGWKHIYLTTYKGEKLDSVCFDSNMSSHQSIGQEFDKVLITLTEDFCYTDNEQLSYRGKPYYKPSETLFQALTRVRKKLMIVIINNPKVYKNCVQILQGS